MVNLVVEILHKGKPIIGGIKYRDNESMNLYASVKKAKDLLAGNRKFH